MDDLRKKLIRTGAKLLKKVPAQSLSLRQVAREAGVSQAAPYRHFEDKEGLLAAIASEGFALLRTAMQQSSGRSATAKNRFRAMGHAYVGFGEKHPEHLRLMFGPYVTPGPKHPELFANGKLAFLTLVRMVQQLQTEGTIGPGDPFHRAMHIWMSIHGFSILYLDHRCEWLGLQPGTAGPRVDVFCDDLLAGMRQPLPVHKSNQVLKLAPLPLELLAEAGVVYSMNFETPSLDR